MKEKKSKLKENITLFKKAWKIPKYKALIKLGIYLIFIFSLILMIRFCGNSSIDDTSNNQIQELNSTQKLEIMSNYEYEIKINENENSTILKGIKYNDINDFEVINDKEKYTVIDNNIYKKNTKELVEQLLNINIISIFNENLKSYIIDENMKNEIKYKDNEIKKEYHIYNFNILENINKDKFIILTTYENNNYIYKIEIDATDVIKDFNPLLNNYNIEINYNNINEIKEYKSN